MCDTYRIGMLWEYTIAWSKSGDHKDEPPRKITAQWYDKTDEFWTFFTNGVSREAILTIRASDVAIIERSESPVR